MKLLAIVCVHWSNANNAYIEHAMKLLAIVCVSIMITGTATSSWRHSCKSSG